MWRQKSDWVLSVTLIVCGVLSILISILDIFGIDVVSLSKNIDAILLGLIGLLTAALGVERLVLFGRIEKNFDEIRQLSIRSAGGRQLTGTDEIYKAGTVLVKTTQNHIRTVTFSGRPKAPRYFIEAVIDRLKETEKEADAIARATPKAKGIIAAKLEQQADEVDKRYRALTERKMQLQEALTSELTEHNIDNLLEFRKTVALGLQSPTNEDKRRWLEILQTKVTVTNGIAVITCRFGGKVRYNLNEIQLHKS